MRQIANAMYEGTIAALYTINRRIGCDAVNVTRYDQIATGGRADTAQTRTWAIVRVVIVQRIRHAITSRRMPPCAGVSMVRCCSPLASSAPGCSWCPTNSRLANGFGMLAAALMGLAGGCVLWWWVADHL